MSYLLPQTTIMRKLLLLIIPFIMVACGNPEDDNDIVIIPDEVSTTTSSTQNQVQTTVTNPSSTTTTENNATVRIPNSMDSPRPNNIFNIKSGAIGRISIPSIGIDWNIYEGIELSVLNRGPGHYPHSPKPCRAGNASIAGHRTTYGAPFNKLDVLKDGDLIHITTPEGDCTYKYLRTEIVSPNNVSVVMPKDNNANLLTLTACHPKGSAKQRIVITASLQSVTVK